jgi:hypothetical protein
MGVGLRARLCTCSRRGRSQRIDRAWHTGARHAHRTERLIHVRVATRRMVLQHGETFFCCASACRWKLGSQDPWPDLGTAGERWSYARRDSDGRWSLGPRRTADLRSTSAHFFVAASSLSLPVTVMNARILSDRAHRQGGFGTKPTLLVLVRTQCPRGARFAHCVPHRAHLRPELLLARTSTRSRLHAAHRPSLGQSSSSGPIQLCQHPLRSQQTSKRSSS